MSKSSVGRDSSPIAVGALGHFKGSQELEAALYYRPLYFW